MTCLEVKCVLECPFGHDFPNLGFVELLRLEGSSTHFIVLWLCSMSKGLGDGYIKKVLVGLKVSFMRFQTNGFSVF